MRGWTPAGMAVVLLGLPHAAAADGPRDIIERAIKAQGGLEELSRLTAVRTKLKGSRSTTPGKLPDVTFTWVTDTALGRMRSELRAGSGEGKIDFVEVLDGGSGWFSLNGQ